MGERVRVSAHLFAHVIGVVNKRIFTGVVGAGAQNAAHSIN
jgi:hypothetical protein